MTAHSSSIGSRLFRAYPALRHPGFRRVLLGVFLSGLGNSVNVIALSLLLYSLTGQLTALVGMWAVRVVTRLLLQPFFGVWVDRLDKRLLLVTAHLLNALAAGTLLLVDHNSLWLAVGVVFVLQALDGLTGPAFGAALPSLVGKEVLVSANALLGLAGRIAGSLGPAVAGLVFAAVGAGPLFLFNALSFVVLAGILWSTPLVSAVGLSHASTFWSDLDEGWRLLLRTPLLLVVLAISLVSNLVWRAVEMVLLPWSAALPELGTASYGLLFSALTLGGLAGLLLVPRLKLEEGSSAKLVLAFGLSGLPLILLALLPSVYAALPLMFACGLLLDIVGITTTSAVQQGVPDAFLGRAFAAVNVSSALGAVPLLFGLAPLTAQIEEGGVLLACGAITALVALGLRWGTRF